MRALFRLESVEHGRGMAGDLDLAPCGADDPVRVDQEGAAFDADELAAVQLLRLDHVEGAAQLLVGVADQVEVEALPVAEVAVRADRIPRYPEDRGAQLAELRQQGVEVPALGGAAGGGVLGIEVQHQPLPGVVGEGGGAAVVKCQRQPEDGLAQCLADVRHGQNFIGSMIASRFRWSQNSRKSSRSAAMCMSAGIPMVTCAVNISAPVCIAR